MEQKRKRGTIAILSVFVGIILAILLLGAAFLCGYNILVVAIMLLIGCAAVCGVCMLIVETLKSKKR